MDRIAINIANDFSKTPGPRTKKEGDFSAEEFIEKILKDKFTEAVKNSSKIIINLDRTAGYATSFLEGSFGQLQRDNPKIEVDKYVEFISVEDPYLIEEIMEYINDEKGINTV